MRKPEITVVEQGPILSAQDFLRLDLVDWTRASRTQYNVPKLMDSLTSWFVKTCIYHIIQTDLCAYPERDDFPQWDHIGRYHRELAEVFWNHFHYRFPHGELCLDDCPDFWGKIIDSSGEHVQITGDFGKVSPIGLKSAISMLYEPNLWISVVDLNTLILIEPRCQLINLNSPEYLKSINYTIDLRPRGVKAMQTSLWGDL